VIASVELITVNSAKPGILLTPDSAVKPTETSSDASLKSLLQFSEFSCLGISVKVFGNGLIGTLSSSVCSEQTMARR